MSMIHTAPTLRIKLNIYRDCSSVMRSNELSDDLDGCSGGVLQLQVDGFVLCQLKDILSRCIVVSLHQDVGSASYLLPSYRSIRPRNNAARFVSAIEAAL
jgi:hypothetical protein